MGGLNNPIVDNVNTDLNTLSNELLSTRNTVNNALAPAVSITFDGGYAEELSVILPLLVSKGVVATTFIETNTIGTVQSGHQILTAAQILQLQAAGWEVGSHTVSHASLPSLTEAQKETELFQSKDILKRLGCVANNLAYPNGDFDEETMEIARKYYNTATAVSQLSPTNIIPINTFKLNRNSFSDGSTLNQHKTNVDNAIAGNYWYIIYAHAYQVDATILQLLSDLIDYIQAANVDILTMQQGYERFANKIDVGFSGSNKFVAGTQATAVIGTGEAYEVTITGTTGLSGDAYTVEVVEGSGLNVAMTAAFSTPKFTVTLGTDGAGALDATKNTGTLVAAAITALTQANAAVTGADGSQSFGAAIANQAFTKTYDYNGDYYKVGPNGKVYTSRTQTIYSTLITAIDANSIGIFDIPFPGLRTTDGVAATLIDNSPTGFVMWAASCVANDYVRLRVHNISGTAKSVSSTWRFMAY